MMLENYEKLTELFQKQRQVRYFPLYAQIILSALVAHFMCGPGSFFSLKGKWDSPAYYMTFGFSFIAAMLVFRIAQWFNKRMDKNVPWLPQFCRRLRLQIAYGVILSMLVVLIVVIVFFNGILGTEWSWLSLYLRKDYVHVFFLVIIMNLIYLSWYMWSFAFFAAEQFVHVNGEMETLVRQLEMQKKMMDDNSPFLLSLRVRYGYKEQVAPVDQIAFFKSSGGERYCELRNSAERYEFDYTLDDLIKYLDKTKFCKISRKYILRRDSIDVYATLPNGKLLLTLKEGMEEHEEIEVSREHAAVVKEWLEN